MQTRQRLPRASRRGAQERGRDAQRRLAAMKSFFRFLEYRQPAALERIRTLPLAIPFKKTDTR